MIKMRKVIPNYPEEVSIYDVSSDDTVFGIKEKDNHVGMIIKERDGYILRFSDGTGSTGHHSTIQKCIEQDHNFGYEFFVIS